jgi:cell division protein FtsB
MAGAPAYRYDNYDYAEAQPRTRRPDISVIPGRGPLPQVDPRIFVLLRVLAAVVLILAVAGIARLQFTNAAVAQSMTHEELAMDVNSARATGSALEVQASNLSNPAYVRDYAANKLGMAAPATVETIALGEDVVVVDENGALSLSGSLAAVARR